jgi:hypothetical protein
MNQNITTDFELFQDYPNPFNPTTNIKYSISRFNSPFINERQRRVILKVYGVFGKEVEIIVGEYQNAWTYKIQFPNNHCTTNRLSSGIYFYSLYIDGNKIDTKKLMMLK